MRQTCMRHGLALLPLSSISFWYLMMSFCLSLMPDRTTVSGMQDRDLVAAVVAGDADGIAEAYDRYAASLYAYGHWLLSSTLQLTSLD